jgi:putative glutamine amidotransferase
VDEERDEFELALAKRLLASPLPTLGICRGMQILGVASGVQLIAHVPDVYGDAIAHRLDHPRRPIPHNIQLEPKSRLAAIMGDTAARVISWHHQAIKTVPDGWNVAATTADGLVEALEHSQHPWMVAVQWHPEMSPDVPGHQRLFQSLVAAAKTESS